MSKPKPDYEKVALREEKTFEKMQLITLWRWEYAKRKYVLEVNERPVPPHYLSLSDSNNRFIDKALGWMLFHCNVMLREQKNIFPELRSGLPEIRNLLISYHNYKVGYDPKHVIDYSIGAIAKFDDVVSHYGDSQLEVLEILHADAQRYGYVPTSMMTFYDVEYGLGTINKNGYDVENLLCDCSTFLVSCEENPDFYFRDRDGKAFFSDKYCSDDAVLYIKCANTEEHIDKIACRCVRQLKSNMKMKRSVVVGSAGEADIQVIIRGKQMLRELDQIERVLRLGMAQYLNWYSLPMYGMRAECIEAAKFVTIPKHEQVSPNTRAMGLWIWDQVHFFEMSVSRAIEEIRTKDVFPGANSSERSLLERAYRLAKKSIQAGQVLSLVDI